MMLYRPILRRFFRFLVGVYLSVLSLLVLFESKLVYPAPSPESGIWNPEDVNFEDVFFQSTDGTKLHGWYFEMPNAEHTILYFHGNGTDVSRLAWMEIGLAERFNANVFAIDYRGYGQSEGKPHEEGIMADASAAMDWLNQRESLNDDEIILFGSSLGGAVAVDLASKRAPKALILDRTFHSLVDIASNRFPLLPVRWLMRNRMVSEEKISKYSGPLLQQHGMADRVVPFWSGRRLYQANSSEKSQFLEFADLGHNDPIPERFWREMHVMLDSL